MMPGIHNFNSFKTHGVVFDFPIEMIDKFAFSFITIISVDVCGIDNLRLFQVKDNWTEDHFPQLMQILHILQI